MFKKVLVLAILTVLILASHGRNEQDQRKDRIRNNPQFNQQPFGQINEQFALIILLAYAVFIGMIAFINIYLCIRCYKKRNESQRIKEQMNFKRMEYATNIGLSLHQLNDPRYSTTIHV